MGCCGGKKKKKDGEEDEGDGKCVVSPNKLKLRMSSFQISILRFYDSQATEQ